VDDLHARAGSPKEKMVQIHGDIFVTRCSRCDFSDTIASMITSMSMTAKISMFRDVRDARG